MSKKGLLSSLIIGLVLTLALGIYTIVSVVNPGRGTQPGNTTISMAFRTGDTTDVFSGYSEEDGTLTFTLPEGAEISPLTYRAETDKYEATSAGELTAVVKLDSKGNTRTYNIKVYEQGTGESADSPIIIANTNHLVELANNFNASVNAVAPSYVKLVADIDLTGINWMPIGYKGHEYSGEIDGNGYAIQNLTISVNADNYQSYIKTYVDPDDSVTRAFIDLGLFGTLREANVKNLGLTNAVINVSSDVYDLITGETPEGAEYSGIARLSVGTLAGFANYVNVAGVDEVRPEVTSRINAYSYSNEGYANGVGGLFGGAGNVQIDNYDIRITIINNLEKIKGNRIGGVVGYLTTDLDSTALHGELTAEDKNVINNIDVSFTATLLYRNNALVGGVAGNAYNADILNSTVSYFKVVDSTNIITDTVEDVTRVGGVVGQLYTYALSGTSGANSSLNTHYESSIQNVNVQNMDVYMVGGEIGGLIYNAGSRSASAGNVTIVDSTVQGTITGFAVGGFVYNVNPNTSITYTKAFEAPVVDVNITANMSGGFAFFNFGTITGFVDDNQAKTEVKVVTTGMGSRIDNALTDEMLYSLKTSSYAAGFVAQTYTYNNVRPSISNFSVKFTATNSANYAGVAQIVRSATISNMDVNSYVTSNTFTNTSGTSFSTTYMIGGAVNRAYEGTTLENINVIVNANQDVDRTVKYGGAIFGGVVARYFGDGLDGAGLTINNCVVGGSVYVNYSYWQSQFEAGTANAYTLDMFLAGGIVGAMQAETQTGAGEYIDALAPVAIANTLITNNNVSELDIYVDFVSETVMGSQGYRVRAIGSLLGMLNTAPGDETVLDLSTNMVAAVEITADTTTFRYSYIDGSLERGGITLGAGRTQSYGSSYQWNLGNDERVTDPADLTGVVYVDLLTGEVYPEQSESAGTEEGTETDQGTGTEEAA